MVREAHYAGAQLDVPSPLRDVGDEDLRGRDGFPSRAVVLADPRLVEPKVVEPLQQLDVPVQGDRGVLADPVERAQEYSEFHSGW